MKTCNALKPTEIKASVFTDKLQRIHQFSPTQRLRRGHFHYVERQGQCKEQRATRRRHPLDLRNEAWGSPNVAMTCRKLWHTEIINEITVNDILNTIFNQNQPLVFLGVFCFLFFQTKRVQSSSQAPGVYGVRAQMFDKVEIQKKKIISNHVAICRPTLHLPRPLLSAAVMSVAPEEVLILEEKNKSPVSPAFHSYTTLLKLQGRLLDS